MLRSLVVAATLLATAGPAASQIVGNTLQAAMDVRGTACTPAGQCQTLPAPVNAINIYFSKNGNAYVYGSGRRGLELPIGRFVGASGGQQGVFVAGNRVDFKFANAAAMLGISFRVSGKRCTASGLATSNTALRVTFTVTQKYCRIVQGRVEQ